MDDSSALRNLGLPTAAAAAAAFAVLSGIEPPEPGKVFSEDEKWVITLASLLLAMSGWTHVAFSRLAQFRDSATQRISAGRKTRLGLMRTAPLCFSITQALATLLGGMIAFRADDRAGWLFVVALIAVLIVTWAARQGIWPRGFYRRLRRFVR